VDRDTAKSCSYALQRYIRNNGLKNVVFASCHYDIIDWLQPDWVFDTSTGQLNHRGLERRPEINVDVLPVSPQIWPLFSNHHYLSGDINKSSRCWIAAWNGRPVGFAAAIAFPNGNFKAYRGHRTVILPDFQGLGIGVRLSDAVAKIITSTGVRYFSKTSNPRMGGYRNHSPLWRATSKNEKARPDYDGQRGTKEMKYKDKHRDRLCWSHEYVGA
jgi:GNAT superfamily N-acetyltransferase